MDIREAYNHWSDRYDQDRNLTRDLDEQVTRRVLAGRAAGAILEIGCGTGKNTAWLVELGEQVLALDFSAGMLQRARDKVRAENVTFQAADLTQPWPCRDAAVELVVCNLVLEHIQDLDFIFFQAARVLQPGGKFFMCELHPFRQYLGTRANFQGRQGAVQIPAYIHHISDFSAAAEAHGLALARLNEWWHAEDEGQPPRLVSMLFRKPERGAAPYAGSNRA